MVFGPGRSPDGGEIPWGFGPFSWDIFRAYPVAIADINGAALDLTNTQPDPEEINDFFASGVSIPDCLQQLTAEFAEIRFLQWRAGQESAVRILLQFFLQHRIASAGWIWRGNTKTPNKTRIGTILRREMAFDAF